MNTEIPHEALINTTEHVPATASDRDARIPTLENRDGRGIDTPDLTDHIVLAYEEVMDHLRT